MDRRRHPWKVLHGLGLVPDEADVACNLLQDIKKHSEYSVTKTVNAARSNKWHPIHMDVVCGPDEEVRETDPSRLSPEALALLAWVKAVRDPLIVFSKKDVSFQPFQNLMVMDFLFYLIQKTCPTEMDQVLHHCKKSLSLHNLTAEEIRTMKVRFSIKHSVYIIPRRHGKTSMFTALMAATVLFIDDIKIGYGCHRKRALKEAYKSTLDVIRNIMDCAQLEKIQIKKVTDESISARNNEAHRWSSILFLPLQSDKVCMYLLVLLTSMQCKLLYAVAINVSWWSSIFAVKECLDAGI